MGFNSINNSEVYADKLSTTDEFKIKEDIPATRKAVQTTFNALTDMLDTNFSTKQHNSKTVYDCNSKASENIKQISMPKGFILYDGVKFLVNIKEKNTALGKIYLNIILSDNQKLDSISLSRNASSNTFENETKTTSKFLDIVSSVEDEITIDKNKTSIQAPIYTDFTRKLSESEGAQTLSKGLYIVEYIHNRQIKTGKYNEKNEPEMITINGFSFETPSASVLTSLDIQSEKLSFLFLNETESGLKSEFDLASSDGLLMNPTYQGSGKLVYYTDTLNKLKKINNSNIKDFYFNAKECALYLPDTYGLGAFSLNTLVLNKIDFSSNTIQSDADKLSIYSDVGISNPYAKTKNIWKDAENATEKNAFINSYTFTGQSRAIMTQEIKSEKKLNGNMSDAETKFYLGYFSEVKDSSFSEDYHSQQRVYLNDTLKYLPWLTYDKTASKFSNYPKMIGSLIIDGCYDGAIRLRTPKSNTAIKNLREESESSYAEKDRILKIDSRDDYGMVVSSKNKILSNDDLLMYNDTTIFAQNVSVNKTLKISKNLNHSNNATTGIDEGTEQSSETGSLQFAYIKNNHTNANVGAFNSKNANDENADNNFSYLLNISGLNNDVCARRIDYTPKASPASIKSRYNLKTKINEKFLATVTGDSSPINSISIPTIQTLYSATPKIAGTYDYNRNTRFWCPTSLPDTDVGLDELGNPNGDICTVTSKFSAVEGDTNDSGSVGWVSRATLLSGQSSFGWNVNTKIKVNSGVKAGSSTSIISNIPSVNSPGKLYNTLGASAQNKIADSIKKGISVNLKAKDDNNEDITVNFSDRKNAGDLLKATSAEIQITLGDSGVIAIVDGQTTPDEITKGQSKNLGSSTAIDTSKTETTANGQPIKLSTPSYTAPTTTNSADGVLGQTLKIPKITVNSKGIVTALTDYSIYIPTAQEILINASPLRNNALKIKNSDGDEIGVLNDDGSITIGDTNKLKLTSLKVSNLEVDSVLLVPEAAPSANVTSAWKKSDGTALTYSSSERAIYVS